MDSRPAVDFHQVGRLSRKLGRVRLEAFEAWRKIFLLTLEREPTIEERIEARAAIRERIR